MRPGAAVWRRYVATAEARIAIMEDGPAKEKAIANLEADQRAYRLDSGESESKRDKRAAMEELPAVRRALAAVSASPVAEALGSLPLAMAGRDDEEEFAGINYTEAAYMAQFLKPALAAGHIKKFWYTTLTLKLGPDCRWTADFWVLLSSGRMAVIDVKGIRNKKGGGEIIHKEDDATAKMAASAKDFPFPVLVAGGTRQPGHVGAYRWRLEWVGRYRPDEAMRAALCTDILADI